MRLKLNGSVAGETGGFGWPIWALADTLRYELGNT